MLYIVLVLVLVALGLLVTALITANSLWAWISIGLSVLAGLLLIVDWLRRRRSSRRTEESEHEVDSDEVTADEDLDSAPVAATATDEDEHTDTDEPAEKPAEQTALMPASGDLSSPGVDSPAEDEPEAQESATAESATVEPEQAEPEQATAAETSGAASAGARDEAPAEEDSDPDDRALVAELDEQVLVVDEYPRYHMDDCGWLTDRDTIPIAVSEARELGFSPCGRCEPDGALAAGHRSRRTSAAE